ncbi:MAG: hypothetical protein AAGD43_00330 [Pseudomonadota bacterium]
MLNTDLTSKQIQQQVKTVCEDLAGELRAGTNPISDFVMTDFCLSNHSAGSVINTNAPIYPEFLTYAQDSGEFDEDIFRRMVDATQLTPIKEIRNELRRIRQHVDRSSRNIETPARLKISLDGQSGTDDCVPKKRRGRPSGTGYAGADEPIVEDIIKLLAKRPAISSATKAAEKLYDENPERFHGGGTRENIIKRLVDRVTKFLE